MERENLPRLVKELKEISWNDGFEVIIVNDDNLSSSVQTIKKLEREHAEVKCLLFDQRIGKTRAIREGFKESVGDIIVIMDADLQYSPADIPRLVEGLRHSDVVNGLRVDRKDRVIRILESKVYNLLVRFFFGMRFQDCNSGLKVLKREVMEDVVGLLRERWHRYLLVLAAKEGYNVIEIPIRHYPRTHGRSKFSSSPLKLINGFHELLLITVFHPLQSIRRTKRRG